MTVDNVATILNKIGQDQWERVMSTYIVPLPLLKEIQRRYSTHTEKIHACVNYYVNCRPEASWEYLTMTLYLKKEFAAARESKSFISTGKHYSYSVHQLMLNFK